MSGGQDLSLEQREDQLHLVQPRGVDRQPMDANLEGKAETANPAWQLLRGMGGSAVQDQVEDSDPVAPEAPEEHLTKGLEVHEALALKTASHRLTAMDQQGGEEVEDAVPRIAGSHAHRPARAGGCDTAGRLQDLDAGLLIGADDELSSSSQPLGLFVEGQHHRGLLQEPGIGRLLPAVVLPGFNLVLPQPRANGGGGDRGDNPALRRRFG